MNKEFQRFKLLTEGSKVIQNDRDAVFLLSFPIGTEETMENIGSLVTASGKKALRTALMKLKYEDQVQLNFVIKFIECIVGEDFNSGLLKAIADEIYVTMYETPRFMEALKDLLFKDRIPAQSVPAIAWYIALISNQITAARDSDGIVLDIVKFLIKKMPDLTELQTLFYLQLNEVSVLETSSSVADIQDVGQKGETLVKSLAELKDLLPQHDNDFPQDFRKIAVFPTSGEMNTTVNTYRVLSSVESTACSNAALLLDRQFRLLREDFLAPMKEELHSLLHPSAANKAVREKRFKFLKPRAIKATVDGKSGSPHVIIEVEMPVALKGRLKSLSKAKEIENYFDNEAGRRVLARDSVLIFISGNRVVNMGFVAQRDVKQFVFSPYVQKHENDRDGWWRNGKVKNDKTAQLYMSIGVTFFDESLTQVLSQLCGERFWNPVYMKSPISEYMVQASATLFSYEPILKCLQGMSEIPLKEELVGDHPTHVTVRQEYAFPQHIYDSISRDPSQLVAAQLAMEQRVSIIQGPPGTGKTYIGVQIVRALIAAATQQNPVRILVLCFTNHALDSFLEDLEASAGVSIRDIVRLGSSPKMSEKFKDRGLRDIKGDQFDRGQKRVFAQCKDEQRRLKSDIDNCNLAIANRFYTANSWSYVSEFLLDYCADENAPEFLRQLTVETSSASGMRFVGKKGKSLQADALWRDWYAGKPRPALAPNPTTEDVDIWALTNEQRGVLMEQWRLASLEGEIQQLKYAMRAYTSVSTRLETLRNESKLAVLRSAKIIGCTTTSAAKYRDLLQSVAPTVVLVEEAAEILESHVLTNINSSTKQLIMIGDHLQLRPKLEHYPLRKDSGQNVDFDVSLFERLAKNGYPVSTLTVQHRMRPAISRYIREMTYPGLEDYDSVLHRSHIRGVSRDVVFISHSGPEVSDEDRIISESCSKVNAHEVAMTVKMVKYFLQQGYGYDEVVILTPYLGQLMKIQSALKTLLSIDTDLGDLDQVEVAKFAGDDNEDAKNNDGSEKVEVVKRVRVATIDNYQGEEARIIIASLVRSNNQGDIGFMSGPERVNVLFSRARDGFFILGNEETYRKAKNTKGRAMWNKLLDKLEHNGCVFAGFPAECTNHKTTRLLATAEDFERYAEKGGCDMVCDAVLPACPKEHHCKLPCHPNDHSTILCKTSVVELCAKAMHKVTRECHSEVIPMCRATIRTSKCPEGHPLPQHNCCYPPSSACQTCFDIKRAQEEVERRAEEERASINKQVAEAMARRAELESEIYLAKIRLASSQQIQEHSVEIKSMEALLATMQDGQRMQHEQKDHKKSTRQDEDEKVATGNHNKKVKSNTLSPEALLNRDATPTVLGCNLEKRVYSKEQLKKIASSVECNADLTNAEQDAAEESSPMMVDDEVTTNVTNIAAAAASPAVQQPTFSAALSHRSRHKISCNLGKTKRLFKAALSGNWSEVINTVVTFLPAQSIDLSVVADLAQLPTEIAALYLIWWPVFNWMKTQELQWLRTAMHCCILRR